MIDTKLEILNSLLINGIKQLNLELDAYQCKQLLAFIYLLNKWNKVYNLTAICNRKEMIIKHLFDSLAILPYVNNNTLLDIGTGAGLPGIVLGIAKPNLSVTLLESAQKKYNFLYFILVQLSLKNIKIIHSRVEHYKPNSCFAQITTRAFASVDKTLKFSKHLLCADGQYLLMKSKQAFLENNLPDKNMSIQTLNVPYMKDNRYLLNIKMRSA